MSLLKVRMEFCNQDISKTIAARSFKFGQLIEDNLDYLKTCNPDISKIIMARSLEFGQHIQDGE